MSESNCDSCSLGRRVTIILHPLYGGAEGNRTPVRNSYMNKTFLRTIRFSSDALRRALAIYRQSGPGRTSLAHLHHLILREIRKPTSPYLSLTSDAYRYRQGASSWKIHTNQAAALSATKVAKAGWIIMTVSVLSFHFWLSLKAVFYLRVLHSQNPVESRTAPYSLVKVYRSGHRRYPATSCGLHYLRRLIVRRKIKATAIISRLVIGIGLETFLWQRDWSERKGSNF